MCAGDHCEMETTDVYEDILYVNYRYVLYMLCNKLSYSSFITSFCVKQWDRFKLHP